MKNPRELRGGYRSHERSTPFTRGHQKCNRDALAISEESESDREINKQNTSIDNDEPLSETSFNIPLYKTENLLLKH